jgi:2-polyprenyl-6-methoxyphenol hydroxylase-like FAD-dependent oxidoreductase
MEKARREAGAPFITMKKFDGSTVGTFPVGDPQHPSLVLYRSKLHELLHDYASDLGIKVDYECAGTEYFETQDCGGVVLSDGRRLEADVVVAADGVGSKSWGLVLGDESQPISSGFVLYRVTFPVAKALENPIIAKELEGYKTRGILHAGPEAHMVTYKSDKDICWLLTCSVRGSNWKKETSAIKPHCMPPADKTPRKRATARKKIG